MKKISLALGAILAISVSCAAQVPGTGPGQGHGGHNRPTPVPTPAVGGGPAPAPVTVPVATPTPVPAVDIETLRTEYRAFGAQLKAFAAKNGIANAYDKYCTSDYTFIRTDKSVITRTKFIAETKAGKLDRPLDGVDAAAMRSRTFQQMENLVVVLTKTEQTYKQDVTLPNGTVKKGAIVSRQLNTKETFAKAADGSLMLKTTDLTDLKVLADGIPLTK